MKKLSVQFLIVILLTFFNVALLAISIAMMPFWITAILVIPSFLAMFLAWPSSSKTQGGMLSSLLFTYVLIFCLWPQFSSYKIPGLPAIEPQRLIYVLVIITWVALLIINKNTQTLFMARMRYAIFPITCLLFVYFLHFLVAVFSKDPLWSFFFAFREFVTGSLIFFAALVALRDLKDVQKLILFISLGAGVVSILAIIESVLKHNLFSSWLPLSSAYAEWATAERIRDGTYRVQAVFDNPLLLVDFLLLVWPLSLYMANWKHGVLKGLFGYILVILIPIALLRTGSRAAILVFGIEVAIFLILWILRNIVSKKGSGPTYLVAGALILSTIFIPVILNEFKTLVSGRTAEEASSSYSRMVMVTRAIDDLSDGNLLGHGFGKSASVIGIKTGPPGHWIYVLDNYFITLALDSGILAMIFYCLFWFWLLYKGLVAALTFSNESGRVASAIFLSISGFILVKMISSQPQIFPLFFIISASLITLLHSKSKE